uniref:Putative salivary kunitz domain protein n=1 Tax=Ixodes ricinus TaxID=34613 RepID=A0A0K8RIM1_IXORI
MNGFRSYACSFRKARACHVSCMCNTFSIHAYSFTQAKMSPARRSVRLMLEGKCRPRMVSPTSPLLVEIKKVTKVGPKRKRGRLSVSLAITVSVACLVGNSRATNCLKRNPKT